MMEEARRQASQKQLKPRKTSAVSAGIGELSPMDSKSFYLSTFVAASANTSRLGSKQCAMTFPFDSRPHAKLVFIMTSQESSDDCVEVTKYLMNAELELEILVISGHFSGCFFTIVPALHHKPPFQRLSSIVYPFFSPTTFSPENLPPSSSCWLKCSLLI